MSFSFASVMQMKKMLTHLDDWLEKASKYAAARSFDPNVLVVARLAPDQFSLARQVQSSCDTAKYAAARLTQKDAPSHADTEQTIPELRARIAATVTYLDSYKADDFAGSEARAIVMPRREGKVIKGGDYLMEYALPNFFFHVTTAYAILRHNGVDVGKRDYLGTLSLKDPGSI
jgi:uncharacterized protein